MVKGEQEGGWTFVIQSPKEIEVTGSWESLRIKGDSAGTHIIKPPVGGPAIVLGMNVEPFVGKDMVITKIIHNKSGSFTLRCDKSNRDILNEMP